MVTMNRALVFDMDGVLVDVGDSYRETIASTVEHFTGRKPGRELIQDYKNRGGFNSDWLLSRKIAADFGVDVPFETVVDHFQRLFLGEHNDGLILRERWIARPGLFEDFARRFTLAIFTGRPRAEARITLDRFAPGIRFEPLVGEDDVSRGKPDPEGLLKAQQLLPGAALWYIGDTVDDARCAGAAGVPFIGIAAPANPRHAELSAVLKQAGAIAVLDNINYLDEVLPV